MKVRYISTIAVLLVMMFTMSGCGGGGSDGGISQPPVSQPPVSQPPEYTLSGDQAKLISDYGNPEYLTISINSKSGIREETWAYSKQLEKVYIFWDGERVKEEDISVDPNSYFNPPYTDPALFTKDTKESHIIALFGDGYIVDDQSEGALSFKTWYYTKLGLAVSFVEDNLVVIQTLDKTQ